MMSFIWPSRKCVTYRSEEVHQSTRFPGVTFRVKRPSLGERMNLVSLVREQTRKQEFLSASEESEQQLSAVLMDLQVQTCYLRWGLIEISGLMIDGELADPDLLLSRGPEDLVDEVLVAIRNGLGLTEEERKN